MKERTKRTLSKTARMLISAIAFVPVIGEMAANARDFYDDLKELALDQAAFNRIQEGIRSIQAPACMNEEDAHRMEAAITHLLENENMEIENGFMTKAAIEKLKTDLRKAVFGDKQVDESVTNYISEVVAFIGQPYVRKHLIDPGDMSIALQDKVLEHEDRIENLENKAQLVPVTPAATGSDNQAYLNRYTEPLFLENDDDEDAEDADKKVTLASMYVPPRLNGRTETAADCIMNWYRSAGNRTCMLLYGSAGVGKSSLVSKILADANGITDDISFPLLADQVLAAALRNHCDRIDWTKEADEILLALFKGYTAEQLKSKLLILDGLDEVCVLRGGAFDGSEFLEKLTELDAGYHVLVTSRDAEGYFVAPYDADLRIETLQWTEQEVKQWCGKYGRVKHEKETWCAEFLSDYNNLPSSSEKDRRREAFCVPVILYICGDSEIKLSKHSDIGSIYDEAFRGILSRTHLRKQRMQKTLTKKDAKSNQIAWQYTKEIAYQMFLLGTLDLVHANDRKDPHAVGLQHAKARTKTVLRGIFGADFTVSENDLAVKKELALCPFARENEAGGITFAHKTVYEYFAAVKLYEDYFAKFNASYFGEKSADEAAADVIKTAIAAFRYKAIPFEMFQYLCAMKKAPFSDPDREGFDEEGFKAAFVHAMETGVLDKITIPDAPVAEYFYRSAEKGIENPLNAQIVRAFRALLCFVTGHEFQNENSSEACKRIREMLGESDQVVDLSGWDLQGANLFRANLETANLKGANLESANLKGANLKGANLQETILGGVYLQQADLTGATLLGIKFNLAHLRGAMFCTDPGLATVFPFGFNPKEHGMIEVDVDGKPIK
ncbi:MAG: pentapeptide repeat-containing protein [Oscillospiraceae bacterium]|nr:pentapeptide repeat-containing protein [Oscillospiraceae bacterium]